MLNQQHSTLNSIDSYIEPLIKRVLQTDNLGPSFGTIELDNITSSCGKTKGDRFKLSIPYAEHNIIWNVFFDSQCPEMGPDFIFNDDTFLADLNIGTLSTQVPSLVQWDHNDEDALLNVLRDLLCCYKQHQIELFKKQHRLQLEYDTLLQVPGIKEENIEIILLPLGSKPTEARFLITISIDLSNLPTRTTESVYDIAKLLVTYYGSEWNRIVPQLHLSKNLETALGGPIPSHLPPFSPDKYLIDYVPEIEDYIKQKINSISQCITNRREFIAYAICRNYVDVIEYDAKEFTYLTLLIEKHEFKFMFRILLPPQFPGQQPVVQLQSIYHFESPECLYCEMTNDFPYSPRWDIRRIYHAILKYVMDTAVENFKENSIKKWCQ